MSIRIHLIWILTSIAINGLKAEDTLSCKGKYDKDSLKHGIWVCRKGEMPISKERYKHGKLITYIKFNEKGKMEETMNRRGKVRKIKDCGC